MVNLESQLDTSKCGVGVASHERSRLEVEELGAICLEMTVVDWGVRDGRERKTGRTER